MSSNNAKRGVNHAVGCDPRKKKKVKEIINVDTSSEDEDCKTEPSYHKFNNSPPKSVSKDTELCEREDIIVGICNTSNGRSCDGHDDNACGSYLKEGDSIVFQRENFRGKPVVAAWTYTLVNKSVQLKCKVGFKRRVHISTDKIVTDFHGRKAQVVEVFKLSEDPKYAFDFVYSNHGVATYIFD